MREPEQNTKITRESVKMFYMTKKGRQLKKFKTTRRIVTAITSFILAIALIATAALGTVYLLADKQLLSGNNSNVGLESETASGLEQLITSNHEGVSYILVVGVDNKDNYSSSQATNPDGYYHTDIIAVACFDHNKGTINVIQIPRDLFIGTDISSKKINAVYACARYGESRINALRRRLASHLGIPIDHYVIFTVKGFINVVDALGGIEMNITQPNGLTIQDQFNYKYYKIGPGWVTLDGNMAAGFVRKRTGTSEGYYTGDPDRLEAQRLMYVALAKKLMNMSMSQLLSAITACYSEVATSMTIDDLFNYALDVMNIELSDIGVYGLPGQQVSYKHHDEYMALSYYSIQKQNYVNMWNKYMNPYGEPLTVDSIRIRELHTELGIPTKNSVFDHGGSLSDIENKFNQ